MSRHAFIMAYDISLPARYRKVLKIAKAYGARMQLSVFRCELSSAERATLQYELEDVIHHKEDRIMLVDLGPVDGFEKERILWIGRPVDEDPETPVAI